ncbi:GNAT family N-acetyltransferase [Diaphorobacter sp. HDW4B]|uniref:GNAT family N-acetyltransferase n=1 Tax=Diaphorobacter sp. HDW4B TaxID=2714925 RepID=UPI00140DE032|nr:GNAT family protein [Diaphorobacter sp. HDW4B]QIL69511.1 GNAT family N-acetyltransferase [Diaphorobacter sp. HDW4B]
MLIYDVDAVYAFLKERILGLMRTEGAVALGWQRGAALSAGVVFENHNGRTVWAHVAVDKPLSREFLRAFLAYPFRVCGVDSVRGYVLASNTKLRALARRLGAVEEARLLGAGPDGGDVVIWSLTNVLA